MSRSMPALSVAACSMRPARDRSSPRRHRTRSWRPRAPSAAELYDGKATSVVTNDDVAVEKSTHSEGRRGVAGTLVVEKIVGAAAEKGMDLKFCAELAADVNARTRSIGVA